MSEEHQGKGRVNISVHARVPVGDYLTARAERLGWKRSAFAKAVFDWWLAQGAPIVHEAERHHPELSIPPGAMEGIDVSRVPLPRKGPDTPAPWTDHPQQQQKSR